MLQSSLIYFINRDNAHLPDDGSIHKIPFLADEKARWRPPQGDTGSDGAFG